MRVSYNWLGALLNISHSPQEMAEILTASGLEVEGIDSYESVKGGLKGLVVGHVIDCAKHPDADRLSVTKVDIGAKEPLSIVCGAPNVAKGQKVVVAVPGTTLYPLNGDSFEIKKSKIRGQPSEGMICAEDEIGIGKSHAGIIVLPEDVKTGTPASDYFKIESDSIFEIGLTPNRSDAASHLGVARDLASVLNSNNAESKLEVNIPGQKYLPDSTSQHEIKIVVENSEACPRYCGLVINGVKVKESPSWLQNRLTAIGIRPINNVVDVTNYVLHELGQPLHAFDLSKIKGKEVVVRNAKKEEKFITLDGVERTLYENDLMICNAENPMCIAGVFGGMESGVTENTTAVFLESAYFNPDYIRVTSRRHSLKTDASFRFERGTDPDMTRPALIRAAGMIMEIAGGVISMETKDVYPEKLEPYKVAFSYTNCRELIGKDIDRNVIRNILLNLGIQIESEGADGLLLLVPRYRTDVTREADVIEEVMRVYGYNNIEPSKQISYTSFNEPDQYQTELEQKAAALLRGFGYSEMMNLSLNKEDYYVNENDVVKVLNPLSNDLAALRKDLIYGGLESIVWNINRKNTDLKLFEFGRIYFSQKENEFKYGEKKQIGIFITGDLFKENPYSLDQKADFSFLKGTVDALLDNCGVKAIRRSESAYEGFSAGLKYDWNKMTIAELGRVNDPLLKKFEIEQEVYYAFINAEVLMKGFMKHKQDAESYRFNDIPRFPAVRRDLALLIDRHVKYGQIEELAFQTERKFLSGVNLFDIYEDEKLGGKKSYAVSFTLINPEATLTDKQIDGVMEKLVRAFKEKLGAELR